MNIEETKKAIEVMQAFVDGKTVQYVNSEGSLLPLKSPAWDWLRCEYRIKPEPKEIWVNEYPAYPFVGHGTKEAAIDYAFNDFTRKAVHYREVVGE